MHPYLGGEAIEPAPQHRSTHALSLSLTLHIVLLLCMYYTRRRLHVCGVQVLL